MPKKLHTALLDLLEALDYTKDEKIELINHMTAFFNIFAVPEHQQEETEQPIIGGVCLGFTIKWLGAGLLQQNKPFRDRITRILDDENTLKKIAEFKKKRENATPSDPELSSELQFWVELLGTDTLGFLDSLMLFHDPKKFDQIFNHAHLSQTDYQRISLLADSDELRARGGLARVHSQTGIYNTENLNKHLSDIQKTIDDMGSDAPKTFGLLFYGYVPIDDHNSGFHAIGATYDTEDKEWVFMDINDWPPQVAVNPEEQIAMLQESIFTALNFYHPNTSYVAINTEVIVLGEDVAQRPHLKKDFHKDHWTAEHLAEYKDLTGLVAVAAIHDDDDCIMAAHQAGFDLNAPLPTLSSTPLIMACDNKSHKVIKALHQCNVDFNQQSRSDRRPAVAAAGKFSPKMLKQFIRYGANLNRVGQEELSPLEATLYFHNAAVIPIFKDCCIDLNSSNKNGNTPLHVAVTEDYEAGVTALLTVGANINLRNKYGETPLYKAICLKRSACFDILLDAHADVNLADNSDDTPLHEACRISKTEMVAKLLAHNAHINQKNKHGETALSIAIRNNDVAISLLLIQQGADLELQDTYGDTSLLTAIQISRDPEIIHALINAGANVNHCNQQGFTVLHNLLENTYRNNNAPQLVRALLEKGANVNQCTKNDEHPVCLALSCYCSEETLLELLKADVDLLTPTPSGKIPLIDALRYSNANIYTHLLNYQCAKYGTLLMNGLAKTPEILLTSILAITGLAHLWQAKESKPRPFGFFKTGVLEQKSGNQTDPEDPMPKSLH